MPRNSLEWLEKWYQQQCNGEREHRHGMRLEPLEKQEPLERPEPLESPPSIDKPKSLDTPGSLQKPGWLLTINLAGTSAVNARPQQLRLDTRGGGWLACSIAGECFEGSGDPRKLEQIIGVFRRWVEAGP